MVRDMKKEREDKTKDEDQTSFVLVSPDCAEYFHMHLI